RNPVDDEATPGEAVHPEDITRVRAAFAKQIEQEQIEEYRIVRPDKSIRWIRERAFPVRNHKGEVYRICGVSEDFTERKLADEALKKERNFVSTVLDTAGALVVVLDPQGRIVRFNRACEQTTGYSFDEVKGKHIWDRFIIPAEVIRVRAIFAKLLAGDFPYYGENYWVTKTGEHRLIAWANTTLLDNKGNIEFIIGTGIDITDRKQAEEKLANRLRYEEGLAACSRTLLEGRDDHDALQEAIKHLLKAVDVDRVYIFENFAYENDGLCIRQTHEVCAPGVKPEIENPLLQHLPYKEGLTRWRNKLSTGEPLQGLVETFPQEEKEVLEPQGILSILALPINVGAKWFGFIGFDDVKNKRNWNDEDIRLLQTAAEMIGGYIEHQQAEEALQESEERFRNLVENANDIIYSLTPEGKFTYVPPNWKDILGHEVSEVLGKSFEPFVHPEDLAACQKFLHKVFESGEKQSGIEYRVKHKNGSWRWHTSSASPFKDENGRVLYYIGIAHDITERKKFIDDLAEANRHLRETQGQLVQSEKMASLGMLVAGIAHEINTPIGAVHSMHDTLKRAVKKLKQTLETQFPKEYKENHGLSTPIKIIDDANKVIENGSERVINIVRRLRSFARLDEAELKTVDIHEGLEDTLTLIHHEIKHNITVTKNFAELPAIACFPGRLNQVYLNLLINAKQAIRDKGEIAITTFQKEGNVHIEIQDNGVGISRDKLSRIFDPGFTTKGVGVGTGLGLSICYQIIKDHKGEIRVKSEVGKGSTFTIVFPMNLDELLENI
ncbi:MAG: PAS domain S-box protein, partial [bacterium]